MPSISVYVHFPWCLKKCPYCDFVSYAAERPVIDHRGYADAVLAELGERRLQLARYGKLRSVFFGGGTPSLWEPLELGRVLDGILEAFGAKASDVEITAECNPSSFDREIAKGLVDAGVNRLSVGVQSLDDERLGFLGRLHSGEEALEAVRIAIESAPRASADLLYAVAGLGPEEAAKEAGQLADLGLQHVAAYALTIEPGTRFAELSRRGRLPLASDGMMVESFFAVEEALKERGLLQYEVSNFAVPGEESRQNLGYWHGQDYLGLGCAAYGTVTRDDGQVLRYRNLPEPTRYLTAIREGRSFELTVEPLSRETRLKERIMLGLRLAGGFDIGKAAQETGAEAWTNGRLSAAERLVQRGRLRRDGNWLTVPREARIWVDDTAAELF